MKKILLNIPDGLLEKVDKSAMEENMTRSEAVRQALRIWLRGGHYVAPINRPGFARMEERMKAAAASKGAPVSSPDQIRKDREGH